ncbi:MAG: nicotinic acid mononucleotide adenylyltransferase, partial [Chitinophagales bacterium]
TLTHMQEKFPDHSFSLIMGGDNLKGLKKWKNADLLLKEYKILVYERPGYEIKAELKDHPSIKIFHFPQIDISSTHIRKNIAENKSVKYYLHHKVEAYIKEMNLYK